MASNKEEEKRKLEEQGPKGLEPYRAMAQQNAIEAIRSAEKRYAKAKDEGGENVKAKDEGGENVKAKESSGAKEAGHALGGSRSAAGEKMHEAKGRAGGAASGVAEKGRQAGEYVAEKAGAVKDSVKETARSATDYLGQKTIQVKEKIGEQTQAAQEKLKGMTIGGKEEGGDTAATEERARREGEAARERGPCHTHWHSRELEQACKATKSREKDAEVVASCGDHHHENKGETEEGEGGKEEMAGDGEQSSGEGGGVGRVKLTREGGGGIFQAMGETVVGIMQTARDMIVGRDSH